MEGTNSNGTVIKRKKRRVSILTRISVIFLLAAVVSGICSAVLIRRYLVQDEARKCELAARTAEISAELIIGSIDAAKRMKTDIVFRDYVHELFRDLCKAAGLKYIYIYRFRDDGIREFIMTAAGDDAEDEYVSKVRGFGKTSDTPIFDIEKEILEGKSEGGYEFVKNKYGDVLSYIIPINDKNGDIVALVGVDYSMAFINERVSDSVETWIIIIVLMFILAFVASRILIKASVLKPLLMLSERMGRFIENNEYKYENSERNSHFEDEVSDIEKSFDRMTQDISGYLKEIGNLNFEKAQNETQLSVAKRIQNGIVPEEFSLLSDSCETYGLMLPAKSVGGDFYDIFNIDDKRVCMVIGDISGKSVSAALFMVMVKMYVKENLQTGMSPAEALNNTNLDLCRSNPENMFATVFVCVLDMNTGELTYANAGHNKPLLFGNRNEYIEVKTGMPLGMFTDPVAENEKLRLKKGDGIFVYTDGVTESINGDSIQFGETRLNETVATKKDTASEGLRDVVRTVVDSVMTFAEGLEQFDDITCAALYYSKDADDGIVIKRDMKSFAIIRNTLLSVMGDNDNSRNAVLACEEIFANIVSYSGADSIHFSFEKSEDICYVSFSDNGVPFDPVNAAAPDKEFEDLDTGGMGIMLVRMYSDEMIYSRKDNRNNLMLKFVKA